MVSTPGAGTGRVVAAFPWRPAKPDIIRVLAALTCAFGAGLVMFLRRPLEFSGYHEVVGYPAFADHNSELYFHTWHTAVVVPAVGWVTYLILARWGPVRRSDRPALLPLTTRTEPVAEPPSTAATVFRTAFPALVVGVEVAAGTQTHHDWRTFGWVAVGCYVAAVLGLSWGTSAWRAAGRERLAQVNTLAALTVIPLLALVSHGTAVRVADPDPGGDRLQRWEWFPLWLALPVHAVVLAVVAIRMRARARPAHDTERLVLLLVVGAVALWLATARLPGALGAFAGFDDAQYMAAGQLVTDGYVPWRDVIVAHGVYADIFAGMVGLEIFERSRWGADAGLTMICYPASAVTSYLLAVAFARRSLAIPIAFAATIAFVPSMADVRFVALPLLYLLLFLVADRRRPAHGVPLGVLGALLTITVPESGYMVGACFLVVFLQDIARRSPGEPWVRALRITLTTAAAAVGVLAVFFIWLHAVGATREFFDYYVIFVPGHNVSGALPLSHLSSTQYRIEFWAVPVIVLATLARAGWMLARRLAWVPRDWVMLAVAIALVLYEQKALARADSYHINQVFVQCLPLFLGWVCIAIETIDRRVRGVLVAPGPRSGAPDAAPRVRPFHSGPAVAGITFLVCATLTTNGLWHDMRSVPSDFLAEAPSDPRLARFGYTVDSRVHLAAQRDLERVMSTYAGPDGKVFDFTNDPGHVYFLADRRAATRFFNVSMAMSAGAQRIAISELERDRPELVVFDSTSFGLPVWDRIGSPERHYLISRYLLQVYRPVLRSHGRLFMVRQDRPEPLPALPSLEQPPQTTDLLTWPRTACNWGFAPQFLDNPARSTPDAELPIRGPESARRVFAGWAIDPSTGRRPDTVLLADRDVVVASVSPNLPAPVPGPSASPSRARSWEVAVPLSVNPSAEAYAVLRDGTVARLHRATGGSGLTPGELTDGQRTYRVVNVPTAGVLTSVSTLHHLLALDVPAPFPSDATALRIQFARPTTGSFSLFDGSASPLNSIVFKVRDRQTVVIRAGSCPQWQSFGGPTLFLSSDVRARVTSVALHSDLPGPD